MKVTLLAIALIIALQAPAVLANEAQEKRPLIGILTAVGMAAGAIVGGPGYAITAMVAGMVYDIQDDKKFALQKSLQQNKRNYAALQVGHHDELENLRSQQVESEARFLLANSCPETDNIGSKPQYTKIVRNVKQPLTKEVAASGFKSGQELASTKWTNSISGLDKSFAYTLQFRTASSFIEPHYIKDLTNLAQLLKQMPDTQLQLAGFSDRMGDESYNQQLSLDRVSRVEHFFKKHGIEKSRIETHAYGESHPLNNESGIEDNSFERRVMISISPPYGTTGKALVSN